MNCWNFEKSLFSDKIKNGTTEYLNDSFTHIEGIFCNIVGGNKYFTNLIFLDEPLYISIDGLKQVPIYNLIVSVEEPDNIQDMMHLIGLDVINQ